MNEFEQKPKILVVDDKPQNLFAMETLLKKLEVEVIKTTSGAEALALVLDHDFCLAIIDVQMPEMDGYELVELLRGNESTQTLPVIFVSAIHSDEYHHRKGYETGAVDFLSKPFIPEILLSKIRVFLDLYHQRTKLQQLVGQLNEVNTTLSKRAAQLEATSQVGRQATSILDLDRLLAEVVDLIQNEFSYYFVGVWLLDKEKEQIVLTAGHRGDGCRFLEPGFALPLDINHSITVSVSRSGAPYLANDVAVDPIYAAAKELPRTRSELALPLRFGPEVFGTLDILSDRKDAFEPDDQTVLQTLADQIAIAIHNARLYGLEKKLRRLESEKVEKLAELNASKDKFFSILSHDLRGPFTSLIGNAQFMLMMLEQLTRDDVREMAQSIFNSAQTTYSLLENLLAWSKMERGLIKYHPCRINLSGLVNNTISLLGETAVGKNIHLTNTVAADIAVYADKNMLDTVIRNLTSNALKFTSLGGQVTILARVIKSGSDRAKDKTRPQPSIFTPSAVVEVSVLDTGVGISPEDQAKLFKHEVHHTTKGTAKEQGTGLGLIICSEMVEKNGGQIWIESEVDRGTTVKFTVPAAEFTMPAGEIVPENSYSASS